MSNPNKKEKLREPREYENPVCAETSPNFFFLDDEDDETIPKEIFQSTYSEAISICKKCEHVSECAEWGIRHETHGFWGGLNPRQRRDIRRSRGITVETP